MGGQRRGAKPPDWPPWLGIDVPREALDVVPPPSPISFLYDFPASHSAPKVGQKWEAHQHPREARLSGGENRT